MAPTSPVTPEAAAVRDAALADTLQGAARVDTETDPAIDDEALELPLTEQRYEPTRLIGAGGMGQVWACQDRRIGREIAVKRLKAGAEDAALNRRFLREARIQAILEHPAVPPVYELGVGEDGRLFFAMRKIRGRTLEQVLRSLAAGEPEAQAKWSRGKLLGAFVQVCLAAHYAHSRGVLHRDLKPANVMLGDYGEVYVLDWGIARVGPRDATLSHADAPHPELQSLTTNEKGRVLTAAGAILGTPGYMSPEQLLSRHGSLDRRSDVYALGMILFEILTLHPGNRGRTLRETLTITLAGAIPKPSSAAPDLPPELDSICARATALEPAQRFESARALADAVEGFLDGDRDLEKRRALADEHAARAHAAADVLRTPELASEQAQATRAQALQEVMRALAFQPEHADARRTLARLLGDVPEHMPPEVEAAIQRTAHEERVGVARWSLFFFVSWLLVLPTSLLTRVRDIRPIVLEGLLCVAAVALSFVVRRMRGDTTWVFGIAAACTYGAIDVFSAWLGPFVLAPTLCGITAVIFGALTRGRERVVHVAMAGLFLVLPVVIEPLHLWSPGYAIESDRLISFARAADLNPTFTVVVLLYATLAAGILAALYFGRMRDALGRAERRLVLHSWHLRQLSGTREILD